MQRFASLCKFWVPALIFAFSIALTSCGGGSSSSGGTSTNTLVILPVSSGSPASSISVNYGDVTAITAQLRDSSGNSVSASSVTWTTDSPNLASVTLNGAACSSDTTTVTTCVCGGTWQNSNIDCIPPSAPSIATVTARASSGETGSIKVYVHPRVARVDITTAPISDCTSSTGTLQLTAQAYDSSGNPVSVGTDATAFTWTSSDASITTVDSKGLSTAVNPGKASLFASVGGHASPPYSFTTCGVKNINIHVSGATDTSFTAAASASKLLAADVVDTKGKTITITGSRLTWSSSYAGVATVDQAGNVSTVDAGTTGITASCVPNTCNSGLNSVFSNVVTGTVTGTDTAQVLAANSSGTSLVPIATSTNTAGTALTLPYNPNSLIYARNGSRAYLGSGTTLMYYDAAAATVNSISGLPGLALAASNNGNIVVIYDTNATTVTVYNTSSNTIQDRFVVSGIPNPCRTSTSDQCPRASFTPDSSMAYVVAGSTLYISNPNATLQTIPLGTGANDVAVTAQGSFAFVAQNDSTSVPFATCNSSKLTSLAVTTSAPVQRIFSSVDATALFAIAPPNLNIITPTTDATGCVPSLTDPLSTTVDLGQGSFFPGQIIQSTSGTRIYFVNGGPNIIVYDKPSNAGSAISLTSGANALSGGVTADGANLYVGGSDNNIHRIDTSTNTDAGQISVSFTPDLVAVRPN